MSPPLTIAVLTATAAAAICWVAGLLTREHSWVDRLWSILPPAYVAWFALCPWAVRPAPGHQGGPPGVPDGGNTATLDARLVLMTILAVAWGARLTYNFARKGGYRRGGEDYRWPVLRQRMSPALFAVFNIVFICAAQHALLLLLALPAWVALQRVPTPLGVLDLVAAGLFLAFLLGEAVADQQQWRFQQDKKARTARGQDVERGFLTTGLFRYSRHPNFFCEQGLWWAFYLFGPAAGAGWLNVSILGPALLTLLFQGSTGFTESLSLTRYPEYRDYQRRTSRLVPLPPRS